MPGIWRHPGASSILPVGMVMRIQAVEHDKAVFSDLSLALRWRERLVL